MTPYKSPRSRAELDHPIVIDILEKLAAKRFNHQYLGVCTPTIMVVRDGKDLGPYLTITPDSPAPYMLRYDVWHDAWDNVGENVVRKRRVQFMWLEHPELEAAVLTKQNDLHYTLEIPR